MNERYKQIQESIYLSSVPVSCNKEYKNISLIRISLVGILVNYIGAEQKCFGHCME